MAVQLYDEKLISLETEYADLASATVKEIHYTKPSGEKGSWTATVSGTKLQYQTVSNDIDEVGNWWLETYIELGVRTFTGTKYIMKVNPIIELP